MASILSCLFFCITCFLFVAGREAGANEGRRALGQGSEGIEREVEDACARPCFVDNHDNTGQESTRHGV